MALTDDILMEKAKEMESDPWLKVGDGIKFSVGW